MGSNPKPSAMNASDFLLREKYGGRSSLAFFMDLLRLKLGEPLAYLIGWQPFLDLKIDLRFKPLIPRPETEFWLSEYVLAKYKSQAKYKTQLKVLDIFSGSGCLGLAFAKALPSSSVTLSDKSKKTLKQINLNAKINNVQNIKIVRSDIFENLNEKYDLILANPPYVPFGHISSSVLLYEPLEAVLATDKGLKIIKKFLKEAKKHLKDGGEIFMEFEEGQASEILVFLDKLNLYSSMQILKDQYGKDRVLHLSL